MGTGIWVSFKVPVHMQARQSLPPAALSQTTAGGTRLNVAGWGIIDINTNALATSLMWTTMVAVNCTPGSVPATVMCAGRRAQHAKLIHWYPCV